jgi:hypothetical protein
MRKLQRMIVLAVATMVSVAALTASAAAQRGSQADSRTLTGRVLNRQDAPVAKKGRFARRICALNEPRRACLCRKSEKRRPLSRAAF